MQVNATMRSERIEGRGSLEAGAVPYGERPAPVRRHGDVLRMLSSPWIERRFAAEEIPCGQVVRQDTGAPYEDDPRSEILVLGDSSPRVKPSRWSAR